MTYLLSPSQGFRRARNFSIAVVVSGCSLAALNGCSATPTQNELGTRSTAAVVSENKIAEDRAAIKAMAGNYKVSFDFTETVTLKAGYKLKEPKLSGAHEVVRVIKDEPGFISLQHILVVGGEQKFPVKHWRHDWVYEPEYVYDFVGFNSWKKRELSSDESKGKWAQFVYQVDDSPRYSAAGDWIHENGLSTWTSPQNMRPLPRRDMTTRDDYHGMMAVNRHVITPFGWVHEQDNTKLILTGEKPKALVREVGVNTYRKSDEFEVGIAENYWTNTKDYWAGVRDLWTDMETKNVALGLTVQGEPTELYMPVMEMTDKLKDKELTVSEAVTEASKIIESYVTLDIDSSIKAAKQEAINASPDVQ